MMKRWLMANPASGDIDGVPMRQLYRVGAKAGLIDEGSLVTATMTGHGLKDPDTAVRVAGFEAINAPANTQAVMKIIGL